MANQLLNRAQLERTSEAARAEAQRKEAMQDQIYRACVYKGTDTMIVEGEEAYEQALADGWFDDPAKARAAATDQLPTSPEVVLPPPPLIIPPAPANPPPAKKTPRKKKETRSR